MIKTKTSIFAITAFLLSVTIMIPQVYAGEVQDRQEADNPLPNAVPDWVDQNFIWYGQGQIQQSELLNAMKFLLDENIMFISEDAAIEVNQLREENQKLKALIGDPPPPPPEPEIKLVPTPGALPELPGFCSDEYEPVCGDDGQTYDNKCRAEKADVEIDYRGECEDRPEVQCPRGHIWVECAQMCIPREGPFVCPADYSWSEHSMRCVPESQEGCPDIWDPVCGADGMTYGNMCEANQAEIEVEYEGECRTRCSSNDSCSDDLVCRDGICQTSCSIQCLVYDPVCGVDGMTYGCGEVDAACHGVEVAHEGECRDLTRTG